MKLPALGLAAGFAITWLAVGLLAPKQFHPHVVVDTSTQIKMSFLHHPSSSAEKCTRQLHAMNTSILSTCKECRIASSECLDDLDEAQAKQLGNKPIDQISAKTPNGVILFESPDQDKALSACQEIENLSKSFPADQKIACFPAETNRQANPLLKSDRTDLISAITMFDLLIALAIAQAIGLAIYAVARKKQQAQPGGWSEKIILATNDALVMMAAFYIVTRNTEISEYSYYLFFALLAITLAWFWSFKAHYNRRRPFWDELREIFKAQSIILILACAGNIQASRETLWVLIPWLTAFLLIPAGRAFTRSLLNKLNLWQRDAVIIGTGENALEAFKAVRSESNLGYRILAFISLGHQTPNTNDEAIEACAIPVVELGKNPRETLEKMGNPQIIVGLDTLSPPQHQRLIQKLSRFQQNIHIIPTIRGLPLFGTHLSHFFSHEVLFLTVRNNLARRSYRWVKRAFDLFGACTLVALLSPVFLTLTILIRRSGGSAFYGHLRVGQEGKPFKCLKFRSMRPDADKVLKELLAKDPEARAEWEKDFKLKNDPRITPVGHFIRKTSLDELPQLFNVIKGEMSLVGPRPVVQDELTRYGENAFFYMEAKPGITGLWQVSGRNDTTYAERISLDSWYVQNWSLWYDIAILFKTIDVVFNRKGAY